MATHAEDVSAPAPISTASHTDRLLGAAVHISSIPWPLLGPLVGLVVFGRSNKYVRAHSIQALMDTLLFNCFLFLAMGASLTYSIFRIVHYVNTNWADFSWQEFLIRFIVGWIVLAILGLINTVISIIQASAAFQGNWPRAKRNSKAITDR